MNYSLCYAEFKCFYLCEELVNTNICQQRLQNIAFQVSYITVSVCALIMQCCRFGMFIPDPGPDFSIPDPGLDFSIPDSGYRIRNTELTKN